MTNTTDCNMPTTADGEMSGPAWEIVPEAQLKESGFMTCADAIDPVVGFQVSVADGRIVLDPAEGYGRVKSNHVVRWYSTSTRFRLKLEPAPAPEWDYGRKRTLPVPNPGTLPVETGFDFEHRYRVGKGFYDLKYSVQVEDWGVPVLDPRIIIDR